MKSRVNKKRKQLASKYASPAMLENKTAVAELNTYWVNTISEDFYSQWQGTLWDFNGTTPRPGKGNIACGYFVTTLLQDMGLKINRVKLATCASSQMMRSLTPHQNIRNLSSLSYPAFNDSLKAWGKGVYIIGLDFHTGFIVNDGTQTWFIHSNYINKRGVTKEPVLSSAALHSSKTRWMVSLTGDKEFLYQWMKG